MKLEIGATGLRRNCAAPRHNQWMRRAFDRRANRARRQTRLPEVIGRMAPRRAPTRSRRSASISATAATKRWLCPRFLEELSARDSIAAIAARKPEILSHRPDREALRPHDIRRRNRKSSILSRESQGKFDYALRRTGALTSQEPHRIVFEIGCESVSDGSQSGDPKGLGSD